MLAARSACASDASVAGLEAVGPGVPAQPLAARLADPNGDINVLIAKAENHLAVNPNDGAGWDLLAPIYMRNGRIE